MTIRATVWCLLTLSLGTGLCSCVDSSDGNGASPSGVPQGKAAHEATPEEASKVCETVTAQQTLEEECTAEAVERTSDKGECEEFRDRCIADNEDDDDDDNCDGEEISEGLSTCDGVTIGDIESCLSTYLASQANLSCDEPLGEEVDPPDCFERIEKGCPDLFDGDDSADGNGGGDAARNRAPSGGAAGVSGEDQGGGDQRTASCEEDNVDASDVDCKEFCTPVAASGCEAAPSMDECIWLCETAMNECPTSLARVSGCVSFEDVRWVCDGDGDLDVEGGCAPELDCFGECVDTIVEED